MKPVTCCYVLCVCILLRDFQRLVLTNLKYIRTQQNELRNEILKLKQSSNRPQRNDLEEAAGSPEPDESVLLDFPAMTNDELLAFDGKFKSASFENKVVQSFPSILDNCCTKLSPDCRPCTQLNLNLNLSSLIVV